jgi:hypothetical protein
LPLVSMLAWLSVTASEYVPWPALTVEMSVAWVPLGS